MSSKLILFISILIVTIVTTLGDYFLKLASHSKLFDLRYFLIGLFIYVLSAFGWYYNYRTQKLSTIGPIYGVLTVLLFTFYTVFFFKEKLTLPEIFGIISAILSITLLSRFG